MSEVAEQEVDWLEGNLEEKREEQRVKQVEFAKLYEVFVNTARGRELLEYWEKTILDVDTPIESSLQRYANDEGVRRFIRSIRQQIRIAQGSF